MKVETILLQYDFNLRYAEKLTVDLNKEQMTTVPSTGLVNHPAFTLGHLVTGSALLAEDLGGEYHIPAGWSELFLRKGPGDPRLPVEDASCYPERDHLLMELDRQHERVKSLLLGKSEEQLSEPFTWRFSHFLPTLIDMVAFMCINHEAMHLGQLAAWRRAAGLDSALALL